MTLKQLVDDLGFVALTDETRLNRTPESVYVSDLLSDVMGKARENMIWVTSQAHNNIVAVASLKELSAIVVVNERKVSQDVIEQAERENVNIIASCHAAFETVGLLFDYLNL
ncbi:MAG: DRTGG domain-containing protein [Bacteroidota bacterium]|nr:DRTGG domain-containing protein [Bacteroidota bacterium]